MLIVLRCVMGVQANHLLICPLLAFSWPFHRGVYCIHILQTPTHIHSSETWLWWSPSTAKINSPTARIKKAPLSLSGRFASLLQTSAFSPPGLWFLLAISCSWLFHVPIIKYRYCPWTQWAWREGRKEDWMPKKPVESSSFWVFNRFLLRL